MLLDNNRNPWLLRSEDIWTIVGEINGDWPILLGPAIVVAYPASCDFSESGKEAAGCGPSGFPGM